MPASPESVLESIDDLESEKNRMQQRIDEISSASPWDADLRGSGRSSISVGCATFSAFSGSPIEDQLTSEIGNLKRKMANGLKKGQGGGFWGEVDQRSMKATDRAIIEYLSSPAGKRGGEVPRGVVRQYFSCDSGVNASVVDVIEVDEGDYREWARGSPASSARMVRQGSFVTASLVACVTRMKLEIASSKEHLNGAIEAFLLSDEESGLGIERWCESATREGSGGGFLVLTDPQSAAKYIPIYCPECVERMIEAFKRGSRGVVFPPIPDSILDFEVYCTENLHRSHTYDDCIKWNELEERLNEARGEMGLGAHRTVRCDIANAALNERHGDWLWVRGRP